ncbi:MAG: 2-oxoacid:acceptor oxidoreductase subunit alpha [Deltaproteobacteria bacterium]|nr:2-oxoacid:acceptor oxidoreductase subunit alpha [Deltaproteobacteria bacterium]MBM4347939.1 2-oxoacid:acceptor oxidoreductase subunit alpha [Deltaproteobacteria bacterium]
MKQLVSGNDAIFQGAIRAGARYFAGYPITPSSEILQQASLYAEENPGFHFLQAEDEIAAAIATISASLAGVKSFTATSGPGFTLMQEALGWGHAVEAPCVIVNSMRVGPSTGMPTQPAQSDLFQIKGGSAGDYYPIAFYPNSVEECFRLIITAFNAAEESLSPVILLADAFLSHLNEMVDLDAIEMKVVTRTKEPLGKGHRLFTGTAHDRMGNVKTNDPVAYRDWLNDLKERHLKIADQYPLFEYIPQKGSDTLLIAFGITSRIISPLKERFSIFRPIRIYPVLEKELKDVAASYRHIIVVEGNDGQYASWVEGAIGRKVMRVACLGGGFKLQWIQSQIEERLKESR